MALASHRSFQQVHVVPQDTSDPTTWTSDTRASVSSLDSDGTPCLRSSSSNFTQWNSCCLVDNPQSRALAKQRQSVSSNFERKFIERSALLSSIDWSAPNEKQRLRVSCRLVRTLFCAFEHDETSRVSDSAAARNNSWLLRLIRTCVQHEAFAAFFIFLTFYALFGPDIAAGFGHMPTNPRNPTLAIINTAVLMFFVLEEIMHCIACPGYLCSGRFWIDTIATVSIIGDTWIGVELINSDAAVAGKSSRFFRLVRIGGRSGRLVRLLRIARLSQILRLVPKVQLLLERSSQELALVMLHKRLWHVFQFHCNSQGNCDDEGVARFNMCLSMELMGDISSHAADVPTKFPWEEKWQKAVKHVFKQAKGKGAMAFHDIAQNFMMTNVGKRAYSRCVQDAQIMKESCAIVERAIRRLTLKLCVLVLTLLVAVQLLETFVTDLSVAQGLLQLDHMANDPEVSNPSFMCTLIKKTYSSVGNSARLQLLVLRNRMYWDPLIGNCNSGAQNGWVSAPMAMALDTIASHPLERHELLVHHLSNGTHGGDAHSVAVFDISVEVRSTAISNFRQTLVVVVMLMAVVLYYGIDMKRTSTAQVLNPLWMLVDDMVSLKSIDTLKEQCFDDAEISKLRRRSGTPFMKCSWFSTPGSAEEMVKLRNAFEKLRNALLAWSKYVPVVLLRQLLDAGVEATIGCVYCEVTILFCDVRDFQDICAGMQPHDVLLLLEVVLDGIHNAISQNGGTFLEFIGDEVLAVFNAPLKVENHSRAALNAAADSLMYASKLEKPVALQCGLHKAQVLCGNIGSATRIKYGALGDGVNLAARLKSLNTRYNTSVLMSSDAVFEGMDDIFVSRTIGKLILKGRSTPTKTLEVVGRRSCLKNDVAEGAQLYNHAFELYQNRLFSEAKLAFEEAKALITTSQDLKDDPPSCHHIDICDQYIATPPPESWDGSEHLTKKAW
mmetsp:Transcript_109086/g.307510  ORF Transcript_109086/g.307510 Transcript_109086/m.307510 type:complete len:949 (-) Transcript_109086:99-2945(-)